MIEISPTEQTLLALLVIFTLPYLFWRLLRTDHFAPLVVVQISFGVLLGPGVLGSYAPQLYAGLFSPAVIAALNAIAMWAVMIFVCLAGIELDLKAAWRERHDTAITAALALLCPLLLGCAVGAGMVQLNPAWLGPKAVHSQFVLGIGMACAVTALPILVLFLGKLGILHQPLGQRVLRYASLDDVAIWAVLALILLDFDRLARQGLFMLAFALLTPLFRTLMQRISSADRLPVSLMWLLLLSLGADWCGLHFMVGAFLAGLVIDADWFARTQLESLREQVLILLMPVFFLSTGLKTVWSAGGAQVWAAAFALLLAAVGGKLLGVYLAARWRRWPAGDAFVVGWLLQTKALIMIIFANVLLDRGVISPSTFTALLLMALMSTMLTIPMVRGRIGS
jgi:Kef-type K+ transport system membrane component KefB